MSKVCVLLWGKAAEFAVEGNLEYRSRRILAREVRELLYSCRVRSTWEVYGQTISNRIDPCYLDLETGS